MTGAQIAVAVGSPREAVAEISLAIEDLINESPQPVRLADLAGPNETVQILLSPEGWLIVAAGIFTTELVKEAAKSTWKAIAPKIGSAVSAAGDRFLRLVRGISSARMANATVILGFPRCMRGVQRHIGVEVVDPSPEEIGKVILLMAIHGDEITSRLDEWQSNFEPSVGEFYDRNPDCSVKIIVTEEGDMLIRATVSRDHFVTKEVVEYRLSRER